MKNKRKFLIGVCAALFAVGILGSAWVLWGSHGTKVTVSQDGKILYTFDLLETADQTFETIYEGRVNTIEISNGQIRVKEADCPDQVCVEMGWLNSSAPIICLPNHLVIEFTETESGLDAVAQ